MRLEIQRASYRAPGKFHLGSAVGGAARAVLFAILSAGLLWLVSIYSNALRDPRYLDGWLLAAGMGLQLGFHIATKTNRLSPKSAKRWRSVHIFIGYLLIAVFACHSNFSLPETGFEFALWAGFVLVTASGLFGTYLAWSRRVKGGMHELITQDRIAPRLAELAKEVELVVASREPDAAAIGLPAPPYDAWISDLYTSHLLDFFAGHRNFASHVIGSQRPLKRLSDQVHNLSRYVIDPYGQEKLSAIWNLVIEKDRLDFSHVHFSLVRAWQFVHVPVTYALIVLSVLHVAVVYAFSSGTW